MSAFQWIGLKETIAIHDRLIVLHGGLTGVRDQGLLESSLARPRHHVSYAGANRLSFLSAIYTTGIVQNHPFVDGNKRTGLVIGALFLEINGGRFHPTEEDAAKAMFALASNTLTLEAYADFVAMNSDEGGFVGRG